MKLVHPYIQRIRSEREIVNIINKRKDYFGTEIVGLSEQSVNLWHDQMKEDIRILPTISKLVSELKFIGKLTKLSSNGSHRGAMLAPPPNPKVVSEFTKKLDAIINSL